MPRRPHYRFRSVWDLDAPPARVYALLEDPGRYPAWWPQVREVRPLEGRDGPDGRAATALIRSVLPYGIHVTLTGLLRDPARGVLEVALRGDIEGWARWTVRARRGPAGPGTRALYEQEVEVRAEPLRRMSLPARPLLRLNHALMMRAGRRGLSALLAAPREAV
ncbi:SRPBCC family protein [Streptomyces sp. NPDC048606]|uniref:SRPBCC family protein n=1 Tax=Streptomyces sp. NPDC048606 TaxID=3154726 RepID=UPI003447B96C